MAKPTDLNNIKYTCTKPSPGKYNITLFLKMCVSEADFVLCSFTRIMQT